MTSSSEKSQDIASDRRMDTGVTQGVQAQQDQQDQSLAIEGQQATPVTRFTARQAVSSIYQRLITHLNSEEESGSKFRSCNEFTI